MLWSNGNTIEQGGLWEDPFNNPSYLFVLIASYDGMDYYVHHTLLSLDEGSSDRMEMKKPLEELLLAQVCKVCNTQQDTSNS